MDSPIWIIAMSVWAIYAMASHHWAAWSASKRESIEPAAVAIVIEEDKSLPEFIPKDRSTQIQQHRDWNQKFYGLLQATCSHHYGKEKCTNCAMPDNNISNTRCSCDSFEQRNGIGELVYTHVLRVPNCSYHSKDHYFD